MIALANSAVCGGGVTAVVYMLMNIPWTVNNIICLVCVIFFNWISSMVGYDKVIQSLSQMAAVLPKVNTELDSGKDEPTAAPDLKNNKN